MDVNIIHVILKDGDESNAKSGTDLAILALDCLHISSTLYFEHMLPLLLITVLVPDGEVVSQLQVFAYHVATFLRHEEPAHIQELVHMVEVISSRGPKYSSILVPSRHFAFANLIFITKFWINCERTEIIDAVKYFTMIS